MERLEAIYQPKGGAREYAEWAVNLYDGCVHGCVYCYGPLVLKKDRRLFHSVCDERPGILDKLRRDAQRMQGKITSPVLLCFTSDPYQPGAHATRAALSILREFDIPFTVLTKGKCAWRDFDLYGSQDCFGMTLTWTSEATSQQWEPRAASPHDRMNMLHHAHQSGIHTWVSLEPVLAHWETLRLIVLTHDFVDHYKVGKLNYHPRAATIEWPQFRRDVVTLLEAYGKSYYIKQDLRETP